MAYQINEFYQGIDKDSDPTKVATTRLRDGLNIRLLNIKGQGFVATNIGGNEKAFSITQGFIPMGYCEYNGIAYIFSYNIVQNEGEIGTYPSPKRGANNSCGTGGFDHVYRPLNNYTGLINPLVNPNAPRLDFKTRLFNFDCEHQIEVFARIDYDDSVNLYFTDFKNPIRSINSGFDQNGVCNNRLYYEGSFPNGIDLLNETCAHPIVDQMTLDEDGCHKAGNWFYFIRYNTVSFNPTSFLGESNAIEIFLDPIGAGITIDGDESSVQTSKSVILDISNLDTSYPYVEIAYVRYFDGTFETGLYDKQFLINPNSTTLQIKITGCEQVIDFTFEEIISKKTANDIAKSITQLENRFFAGNIMTRNLYHPDLVAFANAIIAMPDDTLQIQDKGFAITDAVPPYGQYKDYQKTYSETGYFRSEAYPFAVVFVHKSGRETEPYPVRGFDAWFDPGMTVLNTQGILRFPSCSANPQQSPLQQLANTLSIMGVKFDVTSCVLTQWMNDNICGFYFTRGERNKNILYQGVTVPTYDAATLDPATPEFNAWSLLNCTQAPFGSSSPVLRSTNAFPSFSISFPLLVQCNPLAGPFNTFVYPVTTNTVNNKFGFFSPDLFFNKSFTDSSYVMYKMADVSYNSVSGGLPDHDCTFLFQVNAINAILQERESPQAYNIQEWQPIPNSTFVSLYDEPVNESDPNGFFYFKYTGPLNSSSSTIKNRGFATTRYIGIDNSSVSVPGIGSYDKALINIYSKDPDPANGYVLTDQYDVKNTKYYKISSYIDLTNYPLVNGTVYYKGDCFLQRTYIKTFYNPDLYSPSLQDDFTNFYTFGQIASFVTENSYNTAMRSETNANTYYPATGIADFTLFAYDNNVFESDTFNLGYNQVLSINGQYGYDSLIPYRSVHFPTRIIYSDLHTPNAFSDGYKIIQVGSYRDYDLRLGPINKIIDLNAYLLSFQDRGINYHYVNDRAMIGQGASAGELLIGNGEVLAQKAKNISDNYGVQHQWSITKTDNAVYGIDAIRRKILRVAGGGLELISDTKHYRQEIFNIIDQGVQGSHSDIIHSIPDNPICKGGIVAGYDKKYNEVVFNFMFNQTVENPLINSSVRFNEWIDAFTDKYDNGSPFVLSINNDYHTFNPNIFPSQLTNYSVLGDCWLENVDLTSLSLDNKTTFYGTLKPFKISWYVNQYSDFTKIFDSFVIVSGPDDPYSVSYETIFQYSLQLPFTQPFAISRHLTPHYRESRWKGPVARAQVITNNTNNIYSVNSPMRGFWMKSQLEYFTNKAIFVKSVQTDFRISYQ